MANDSATQVQRKSSKLGGVSQFSVPPFPQFPARLLVRYPELRTTEEEIRRWTDNLNNAINRAMSSPQQ